MQDGNGNAVGTPTLGDFKKVKDCILRHSSFGPSLDGVGGRSKRSQEDCDMLVWNSQKTETKIL